MGGALKLAPFCEACGQMIYDDVVWTDDESSFHRACHPNAERLGRIMTKPDDITQEAWDAATPLYEEIFRVGKFLRAPVPFNPQTVIARAIMDAQREERERCAKIAERDVDWTLFSRAQKTDWRGNDTNVFAPPSQSDDTLPTDINVFAYTTGIAAGRSIAAAIRKGGAS